MSGGHFDYNQYHINEIADEVESLINKNNDAAKDEWGETVGRFYTDKTITKFKEASLLLRKAAIAAQRIDWLICGDDDEESFHERWDKEMET